ncbi:MAG: tRNA dihydrouridine synthase [Spirochaetota bacterium]
MTTLWRRLPRPIHALAPMEDVTDTVFRRIIAGCGRPDVFFTEFIHTDVVLAPRRNRPGVTPRLVFTPEERPLIVQIWGTDPEAYRRAAGRLAEMGFDGIDINMGCPVRKIRKKGACSALILQPKLAAELIAAAREGARGLPVGVKTRIGYAAPRTEQWIGHLLEQRLDALTVHGRCAEQESEGPVDWDEIARAAAIGRDLGVDTAVLGNGDVTSRAEIRERSKRYGLDGVMVGRGVFADPYVFSANGRAGRFGSAPAHEKVELLLRHLRLYRSVWGDTRNYEILKKFYKVYVAGFPGAEELRSELNATHDYDAAERVVADLLSDERREP